MNSHYDLEKLSAGASYYDKDHSSVYYRGDGVSTIVRLPGQKIVSSVVPETDCYLCNRGDDGEGFICFFEAVQFGLMIEIVLKDNQDEP